MEGRAGSVRFWAVTIMLVFVTAFCFAGTVRCGTGSGGQELENDYRERERQLVEKAREYLDRQGYADSGVMLTRVVDADGSREYTLRIHHGRIAGLSGKEREKLVNGLQEIAFEDQHCVFSINL